MGIEPTLRAWEAPVLPLNYTRTMLLFYEIYDVASNKNNILGYSFLLGLLLKNTD